MLAVALLGIGCASSVEGGVRDEGVDYARFRVVAVDDMCVTTLVETGVLNPTLIQIMASDGSSRQTEYEGKGTVTSQEPKISGKGCGADFESAGITDSMGRVHGLPYCQAVIYSEPLQGGTDYECARSPFPPRATKESG